MTLNLVRRDDALLEDEAAVEAPLAGLDDAIGLLGEVVEGEALDRPHRPRLPFRRIDLLLHLGGDRQDLGRLADDFHAQRRLLDERVERHHRQDRPRRPRGRDVVDAQQLADHRLARDQIGREIGVAEDDVVAMPHGAKCPQDIGVQHRIDRFQHYAIPPFLDLGRSRRHGPGAPCQIEPLDFLAHSRVFDQTIRSRESAEL